MAMKELSLKQITGNIFKTIQDDWLMVAAGTEEGYGAVMGSGCSMGTLPGQEVSTVFVHHPHEALRFIEDETHYSLCFFDERNKNKPGFTSSFDADELADAGLEIAFHNGVPYFENADTVCICKKLYADDLTPDKFLEAVEDEVEEGQDLPRMYMGGIVAILKKDDNDDDIDDMDMDIPAVPAVKPKASMPKPSKWALGVVAAAVLIFVASKFLGGSAPVAPPATTTVGYADLTQQLSASGRVATADSDTVFLPTDFNMATVRTVDAQVGDIVTAGQRLATFDTTDLAYNVTTAENAYMQIRYANDDLISNADILTNAQNRLGALSAESTALTAEQGGIPGQISALQANITTWTADLTSAQNAVFNRTADRDLTAGLLAPLLPGDPLIPIYTARLANEQQLLDAAIAAEAALNNNISNANQQITNLNNRNTAIGNRLSAIPGEQSTAQSTATQYAPFYLTQAQRIQLRNNEEAARRRVEEAQEALNSARRGVVAPRDGILLYFNLQPGFTAQGGSQVAIVGSMSDLEIAVPLSKYELEVIQEGQQAIIKIGNNVYTGHVTRIDHATNTTTAAAGAAAPSNYVNAYVRIDNVSTEIPLGLEANVTIITGEKNHVLSVPITAVVTDIEGTYCYVMLENGEMEQRHVVTGISDNTMTEILEGLQEGEEVLVNPALLGAVEMPRFFG